jgi:hypothetical protein
VRTALLVLVLLLGASATAHAYPQWQFSSGTTRCASCHFSPVGGGLLSAYGRDEAGEELSTFHGDGTFLHGVGNVLPSWLALGGDLRGAFVANDVGDPGGPAVAVFPMQAELAARIGLPAGFSLSGVLGLRGQVRKPDEIVPDENYQPVTDSTLISREHYLMWRPAQTGIYARVGRFYAPFGLRLPEHIFYVRRDLGFNLMEESYNLSVGYFGAASELHVTAFAPDFVRHLGGTEWGGAAYYERHIFAATGMVGGQARVAVGDGVKRYIGGVVAKQYVEPLKTIFLAEANLVRSDFDAMDVGSTWSMVGLVGASLLPVRGTMVSIYGERSHSDLRVANAAWNAADLELTWFPYAHIEVQLLGRLQFPAGGDVARTLLAQVHYFL